MKILHLEQGSEEWLAARSKYRTASEAPAMMGMSPYQTRGDLLHTKYSGETKEVSPQLQAVFDNGHESEANCRPAVEKEIGEDLFPCMVTDDEGWLSASLDGMTMNRQTLWEHKQFSQSKVDFMRLEGRIPEQDECQVQQQLMLTGAKRCIYTVGNDPDNLEKLIVLPDPKAFEAIRAGWKQFDADLESYEPQEPVVEAVGHTMESLPSLRIELSGMVKASNLAAYKDHALGVFNSINTDLQNDQDFADAESTVKWCKDVEDRLDATKQAALSQTADIEALFSALDDLKESARQKRLELDKLVKARKVAVRDEIRRAAESSLDEHMIALDHRLGGRVKVPWPNDNFAGAMKNKRTIASLRDAVDQVLADAKIEASAKADAIQANLKTFDEIAADYKTLFPDLEQLSYKAGEDFTAAVKLRIADHKAAEEKRLAEEKRIADEKREADERRAEAERMAKEEREAAKPEPVDQQPAEAVSEPIQSQSAPTQPKASNIKRTAFEQWWHDTGSGITPRSDDDMESHAFRVSLAAFEAGVIAARDRAA